MIRFLFVAIFLVEVSYAQYEYGTCGEPLVPEASIRASSYFSVDRGPDKARKDSNGAWTALQNDFSQWVEFDLKSKKRITGISTWGKGFTSEFVQEYRIYFGDNGGDFQEYKDRDGNTKLFEGNRDGDREAERAFHPPIVARYIRVNPTRWRDRISLRVEFWGCEYYAESMNFDGKSYVRMIRPVVASTEDEFRFRFRTNFAHGVVLYSRGAQRDLFALQLVYDQMILNIDLAGDGVMTRVKVGSLLDDNLWHDVIIRRERRAVEMIVDRVVIRQRIKGDSQRLDLNREWYFGGMPHPNQPGIETIYNFTGCIENMFINRTDLVREIRQDYDQSYYTRVGSISYSCHFEQVIPVTFVTEPSWIRVNGYMQRSINCSLDFRTFEEMGMILYNKFSTEGHVKIYLDKGRIRLELQGKDTPLVTLKPFDQQLNDGHWHRLILILAVDRIELHLDDVPSITTRQFSMESGNHYLIGGGLYGSRGFVGCMRYIYIEGRYINVLTLSPENVNADVVFDACTLVDKCSPNPCEHGGVCRQNWFEFICDCARTGYTGAVCHVPRHPLSCEAYRIENPKKREEDIYVDVDGSGPLSAFPVHCIFHYDNRTETVLHHKQEATTDVNGYPYNGSYVKDIIYDAPMEQISMLINRSAECRQLLSYHCYNSKLFNSPQEDFEEFMPFGWWVSRDNMRMEYWGGSVPGSRKCRCGLYGTCRDPNKWCNCDSGFEEWLEDTGELTERDFLPVRQLRFGDTGSPVDPKRGRYRLGPLHCEGDSLFDNVVTFRYSDATIEVPFFEWRHSGDIYFQFKTTALNGVILHARGEDDYIKVSIVSGDQIHFQYSAGNGLLGVSVDTSYRLANDEWHSVLIERNRKEARVIVDGSQSAEVRERLDKVRPFNLTGPLVIGATADYKEGFVGCIRAFVLNGQLIDLQRLASRGMYGISTGCVGKCISNPCLNNGICIEGYSHYTCDCQWTPFKGPICADEIGVNLRADMFVRYDFETTVSTLEEYIRVAFSTTEHRGLIFGMSSKSGEYLSLVMSTSGHLRLVFDFGFERQELIIKNENFALGQIHDVQITRSNLGSRVTIYVDNYEPQVHTFTIRRKADAQFNELKSIYIGRNETMGTGDGFVGCISRVQFEDILPLRRYFQESRRGNVHAYPKDALREDYCGIEPVTHPEEVWETRPPPTLPPGVYREPFYHRRINDATILGIVLAILVALVVLVLAFMGRFVARHKGDYETQEDKGAEDAPDADTAIRQSKTGHLVTPRKEWFL